MTFERYSYVGGPPPLFVHQYSHAWVDFRGSARAGAAAHRLVRRTRSTATRAHKAFCLSLSGEFPGYTENVWGITASDSRKGYVAWGGPPRDTDDRRHGRAGRGRRLADVRARHHRAGAARDAAAIRRARFTGDTALPTPFTRPTAGSNPDVIGIDLGITLLSAENLRTGRVWAWFMRNPEIPAAMDRAGLLPRSASNRARFEAESAPVVSRSVDRPRQAELPNFLYLPRFNRTLSIRAAGR